MAPLLTDHPDQSETAHPQAVPEQLGDVAQLLALLPRLVEQAPALKETLLANLAMIGEIPAPTFNEAARVQFLQDRFSECGLQNCAIDEAGNVAGVLPGLHHEGDNVGEPTASNILVVAHTDTVFSEKEDHTISVTEDKAIGPGVGDNSLGVAALATLPTLLDHLGVRLNSNLVLMGSVQSLGRGDLAGLRFFLDNKAMPIRAGVIVEGVQLGRLSYTSIGMLRAEITVDVPERYDWTRFDTGGAISLINDIVSRIQQIPLPSRPRTTILLGKLQSGASFNTMPTRATLGFEIRSESGQWVQRVHELVVQITQEIAAETGASVTLNELAHRDPGGVPFGHPLVQNTRAVMNALGIEPQVTPSISELASFITHQAPAVTLGLTAGEHLGKLNEAVAIQPMFTGLVQLIAVLMAIDQGFCDEN